MKMKGKLKWNRKTRNGNYRTKHVYVFVRLRVYGEKGP